MKSRIRSLEFILMMVVMSFASGGGAVATDHRMSATDQSQAETALVEAKDQIALLRARFGDLARRLDQVEQRAFTILNISLTAIGLLSLGGVAAGLLGIRSWNSIRKSRDLIQANHEKAAEAIQHIEALRQGLQGVREDISTSLQTKFNEAAHYYLADSSDTALAAQGRGDRSSPQTSLEIVDVEDFDSMVVFFDRMQLEDDDRNLAPVFRQLARIWQIYKRWPQAVMRAERAIELDSTDAEGYLRLGTSCSYWADTIHVPKIGPGIDQADVDRISTHRNELIDRALKAAEKAAALGARADTARAYHLMGWTLDERGELKEAATILRRGWAIAKMVKAGGELELQSKDRNAGEIRKELEYELPYTLACILAKLEDAEAFALLQIATQNDELRVAAKTDVDLTWLRSQPSWASLFPQPDSPGEKPTSET